MTRDNNRICLKCMMRETDNGFVILSLCYISGNMTGAGNTCDKFIFDQEWKDKIINHKYFGE